MDTAKSLLAELEEAPARTVLIDITRFFPGRDETRKVIIEWAAPSVKQIYMISLSGAEVYKQNPDWTPELAADVATFAACHISPPLGGLGASLFYAGIAKKQPELYSELMHRLQTEFPLLKGTYDAASLEDWCLEVMGKHPEMMESLPANILPSLKRVYEARKAAMNNTL